MDTGRIPDARSGAQRTGGAVVIPSSRLLPRTLGSPTAELKPSPVRVAIRCMNVTQDSGSGIVREALPLVQIHAKMIRRNRADGCGGTLPPSLTGTRTWLVCPLPPRMTRRRDARPEAFPDDCRARLGSAWRARSGTPRRPRRVAGHDPKLSERCKIPWRQTWSARRCRRR